MPGDAEGAPKFLAVDFYCGAGGATRGLLDAGGYVIAGIDKDVDCRATYQGNNPNHTLDGAPPEFLALDMFPYSQDYPQGEQHKIRAALGEIIPHYRRMAAGVPLMFTICAPCQSFTKFVQRRLTTERAGSRDRDQNLLLQTVGFIEDFRPEMIISENVPGIGRGKHRQIWSTFQSQLRDLGYAVGADRVCTSRFGIAQHRRRSILMAVKKESGYGVEFDLPVPNHDPETPPLPPAQEAIDHLPKLQAGEVCADIPNHVCRNLTQVNRQRLMSVKPGEPNFVFAHSKFGDLSLPCHRRLADKGKQGFGDVYTRIRPDQPAPTITTRFHSISNGRFGHYDETQVRGLSLREGALLQSFPENYEFYGEGADTIAKMIGNAVPPKLSAYMAQWLLGLWQGTGGAVARVD